MIGTMTTVKLNGRLGHCMCGNQTTTILKVHGVPRHISPSGMMDMPYCDNCLPAEAKAMRDHEGSAN